MRSDINSDSYGMLPRIIAQENVSVRKHRMKRRGGHKKFNFFILFLRAGEYSQFAGD